VTTAVLSPRGRRDLLEAVRWIAGDNPAAARAFRGAVARAARRLSEHPEIGVERPELADPPVRFLSLTGFPYLIVYDADRRPPLILRVLHAARDLPEVLRET
jgi:toxin ParE1/3/4